MLAPSKLKHGFRHLMDSDRPQPRRIGPHRCEFLWPLLGLRDVAVDVGGHQISALPPPRR